jgi:hypothetical protein
MMKKITLHDRPGTFFGRYQFPLPRFETENMPWPEFVPIWQALSAGDYRDAVEQVAVALNTSDERTDEQVAALRLAQAAGEMLAGDLTRARRHAGRSLDLYPRQYSANRILLSIQTARKSYAAAYHQLLNLSVPRKSPKWDDPLSTLEIQTALAAWSWQLGEWDNVANHLSKAYPKGLVEMPPEIREEWFRLSLYRGHPEDAAAAAALIIREEPVESADQLLQTIVQSGWTKEALPLYRDAYAKEPKSELLRRRLVALCIREGELDEARALATSGALRLAA